MKKIKKQMNCRAYTHAFLICLMFIISSRAWSQLAEDSFESVYVDIINGNKIIFRIKDKADFDSLSEIDFNKLIDDLHDTIPDNTGNVVPQLKDGELTIVKDSVDSIKKIVSLKNGELTVTKKSRDSKKVTNIKLGDEIKIKLGEIEIDIFPDSIDYYDDYSYDWSDKNLKLEKSIEEVSSRQGTTRHFNVDIGINNWLENGKFPEATNAPYAVKSLGSWYVALNGVNRTWVSNLLYLEWGLGVSWYNFKLENAGYKIIENDDRIELIPAGIPGRKSKLTASYLNAYFVPVFDFSRGNKKKVTLKTKGFNIKKYSRKGFRVGAGGYAGYRMGSHVKFKDNNDKKEKETNNFYLQNLRYGVRITVGWKGLEFYGMYDLNPTFYKDREPLNSPGLNAFTFGITL